MYFFVVLTNTWFLVLLALYLSRYLNKDTEKGSF